LVENHNLLHKATIEENLEMVSFFASLGVDVNKQDNLSHSPQFYAMKSKNKQIIQVLRKYGGRVISPIADIF
jgi:ankyrin repeat protein